MTGYLIAGIVIVVAVFFTLCRIAPLRRWLGYATIVDILFTVGMFSLFHDTFSGVMAACFAGLFMAVMLTALRKAIGYERMRIVRNGLQFSTVWVSYVPNRPRAPKFVRVVASMMQSKRA